MIAKAENTSLESVRVLQRKLYLAAKMNPKRKFGVLYDKVCQSNVLRMAYNQVKANKGAPGIDHQTFQEIEMKIGVSSLRSPCAVVKLQGENSRKAVCGKTASTV